MDEQAENRALHDQVQELAKQHAQILDYLHTLMQFAITLANRIDPPERPPEGSHVAYWRLDPDGNIWSAGMLRAENWPAFSSADPTVRLVVGPTSEEQASIAARNFEAMANERAGHA